MATTSAPRINGVQQGDSSIDAASYDVQALQGLWKAIHAISREDGFGRFAKLVERVNLQEADLKDKANKINALETQLRENETSYSASKKELFEKFEERHQQWREENKELRSGAAALNTASKEKEKSIAALQGDLKKIQTQVSDLEKAYSAETKSVKNKIVQLAELDAQRNTAVIVINDLKAQLKKAKDEVVSLKGLLQKEANEKQKLLSEAAEANKNIERYEGYTVKIESLDLPAVTGQLEVLWGSVTELVQKTVGRDLPDDVLRDDWSKLKNIKVFNNQIPLPQNNSNIAKHMRIAVILGAVAGLVVRYLFQPTYVLDEDSGLRRLLRRQATIDPLKEVYTRGILLSMAYGNQDEIDREIVDFIDEDLKDVVGVDVLFATEDDLRTFMKALCHFLYQFQDVWKQIQRGKQKLEPNFDAQRSTTRYPWYIVGLPATVEAEKRTSSPPTTTDAQHDYIIVPQIVQMRQNGGPEPTTHGWVLQKARIHAADEEILRISREVRTTPFVEETQDRPRMRPRRAMSMSGNASHAQTKNGPFLP